MTLTEKDSFIALAVAMFDSLFLGVRITRTWTSKKSQEADMLWNTCLLIVLGFIVVDVLLVHKRREPWGYGTLLILLALVQLFLILGTAIGIAGCGGSNIAIHQTYAHLASQ